MNKRIIIVLIIVIISLAMGFIIAQTNLDKITENKTQQNNMIQSGNMLNN